MPAAWPKNWRRRMRAVGRKRTKDLHLPAGTREIDGVWYWQPTTKREREERRLNREKTGEPIGCTLGPAGSIAARKKWAEVSGYAASKDDSKQGTVGELLALWEFAADGLPRKPNGKPRAGGTIKSYKAALPAVKARFAGMRYGRSEQEASRGKAIGTVDVQQFVAESESLSMGNLYLAVLLNVFGYAIRKGRTTYNPAEDAVKNGLDPRGREPLEWEVEALGAMARPLLALMMDYEGITGDRVNEILAILRAHCVAEGIRILRKGRKWETWEWSPELRRIFNDAAKLPGATKFPKSPLFPGRRGKRFTYSGFDTAWQALKRKTNEVLAAGIVDPDTLELHAGLVILDLHFHDLRSKAHDDAEEERGEGAGAEQIGDTRAVAKKHYARREKRKTPRR